MLPQLALPQPLLAGTLIRRYQRFLADVRLDDGRVVTAHCPNSGRMLTCSAPGSPVRLSVADNPRRKLPFTLELVQSGSTWVGVNTQTPNRVAAACVEAGVIPELAGYRSLRREVVYGRDGRSRIDIHLADHDDGGADAWVEVKNTTLRVGDEARFPDAVTARGLKHLEELEVVVDAGDRGVILFFVGRDDCSRFAPAEDIDPAWTAALRRAVAGGVEPLAWAFRFTPPVIEPLGPLPVDCG
jgi:sugar fermentation stimulation protein A